MNATRRSRKPKKATKKTVAPSVLSQKEVCDLVRACSKRGAAGIRDAALIATMYGAGLRVSEALALKPVDVDLSALEVTVNDGKGGKSRKAALLPDAEPFILRWIEKRRELKIRRGPLFATISRGTGINLDGDPVKLARGKALSRPQVHVMLKRIAERAGLEKRIHAHAFRHSHARRLVDEGWAVDEVQHQLGHCNLSVTSAYLRDLGADGRSAKMRAMREAAASEKDGLTIDRDAILRAISQLPPESLAAILQSAD